MITQLDVTSPPPFIVDLTLIEVLIFISFLRIMASRMVASYGPQFAQANEEPPLETFLDLTLTQHPCDEEPEPREVRARLEVKPPRAWYYRISPNSRTLVIQRRVSCAVRFVDCLLIAK
jgi:hypothetical protein